MIETGEVLSPVVGSRVTKIADELVTHMLREVERETGERRATDTRQFEAEKAVKDRKVKAASNKPSPLECAAKITERHRMLWDKVSRKLVIGLRKTDPKEGLERLKVVKLAGDILSVVVKGQRQAWGLEALESEIDSNDTEEFIKEMASLTAPSRADTSVE